MLIHTSQTKTPVSRTGRVSAFTLIEVLISAVIAAIVFVAVFAAVSDSFSIMTVARQNLRATQIMVSRLEGLRLEAWDTTNGLQQLFNPTYVPPTFTEGFYPLGLNGTTNEGMTYYGTMTVVQLTNSVDQANLFGSTIPSYASQMALVTVTLDWTNSVTGLVAKGTAHSRTMSTLVAQYGIQNYVYYAQQ